MTAQRGKNNNTIYCINFKKGKEKQQTIMRYFSISGEMLMSTDTHAEYYRHKNSFFFMTKALCFFMSSNDRWCFFLCVSAVIVSARPLIVIRTDIWSRLPSSLSGLDELF